MAKLELGKVDVIHAFPTSGKTGLVLSAFEAGAEVPYIVDTDHILFGLVLTSNAQTKCEQIGHTPWRQSGKGRVPTWTMLENMAMMLASMIANKVNAVIITNLVSTLDYLDGFDSRITLAPSELDMLKRHEIRAKAKGIPKTSDAVLRDWYASYMKHVNLWQHHDILEQDEYLCDYFGVKYTNPSSSVEAAYNKWLDSEISKVFNTWKWKTFVDAAV